MESENKYQIEFQEKVEKYSQLVNSINDVLENLLIKANIPILTVSHRIKSFESFEDKIDRKQYSNPIDQIEDICGLRIICYYRSDVIRISELIATELEILESFNKEDLLKENEFGYRSFHIIAKIPDTWSSTPNYRNLTHLKFEIQIRTVLMHAWAEIQHKLAYKSENQIPKSMRKEFAFLSAKLEESDFQFERLKNERERLKSEFITILTDQNNSPIKDSLNLDELRVWLELNFPDRKEDLSSISKLLDDILEANLDFNDIVNAYEKAKGFILKELEKSETFLTRSGIIRTALNLTNDLFWTNYVETVNMEKYADWVKEKDKQRDQFKEKSYN